MSVKYRPDIDGLRAVAVLVVLGFHAFPALMPGGFIGVDVFFVISGYLISTILLNDHRGFMSNIFDFYYRRILRIFPALILVLYTCFFVGWYTLLGDEFKQLGKHILAGATFFSNIAFWLEAGYFDKASELKPLLHLWSLGVEEQFYICWPLLLLVMLKFERRLFPILIALIAASFSFSLYCTYADRTQAFYSPLTRSWELLVGAALAYACYRDFSVLSRLKKPIFPLLGLALILGFSIFYQSQFYFPGWLAVLPVLSTVFILLPNEKTWVHSRVLSSRPLVVVGLISYPLYLWHWPLLSFSKILDFSGNTTAVKVGALLLAFCFAGITYIFLERPFRRIGKKIQLSLLILLMGLVAILGWNIFSRNGLADIRYRSIIAISPEVGRDFIEWGDTGLIPKNPCEHPFKFPGSNICLTAHPNAAPTVAVIGDSHAFHAYWGLKNVFDQYQENVTLQGRGACLPLRDYIRGDDADHCQPHMNETLTWIEDQASIEKVILIFRGRYLPTHASIAEKEALSKAIERTISSLQAKGKKVYIFYPVAEPGFDPRLCVGSLPLGRKGPDACAISLTQDLDKRVDLMQLLSETKKKFPLTVFVDPSDYLCSEGLCPIIANSRSVFKDDNHLSFSGSLLLGRKLYDSGVLR